MASGSYAVLKYLPNRERDEPRNVGVILASNQIGALMVRMTRQPPETQLTKEQLAALDGFARGLEAQLRARLSESSPEVILRAVGHELANSLIATDPRPVVVDDPKKVLDQLYDELVKPQTQSFVRQLFYDVITAIRERERPRS